MASFENCFKAKRVVVTGAGKGIGRALTIKLHELGAKVYAVSRTKADLDSLTTECPNVVAIDLDVADWDKTRAKLSESITEPIDILVNNAAVAFPEPFMAITSDTFDNLVSINLKSLVNISQICAQKMMDEGNGGTIINISSAYAIKASATAPLYCAIKSGIDSLTKTMAMELGKHQIKVVAMNLGYIWTRIWENATGLSDYAEAEKAFYATIGPQFPLGKVFIPVEQAVNSILFVASGSVDMMTGNGFVLDGGYCAN